MAKIILQVDASITSAQSHIHKLKTTIDELAGSFNKLKANKDVTEQIKALTEFNKSLAAAVTKVEKANNTNAIAEEKLTQERAKSAQQIGKLHIVEEKLEQQKIKTVAAERKEAEATKEATDEIDKQDKKAKGLVDTLMQWSVTSKLVYSGIRMIKSAVADMNETLAETEHRIIAIQRVLPEGSVADQDLANRLYDLAIQYGQSFANVSDIATGFARTGLSYVETIDATRAALLALNVAELDSTQATEGMIAIMAQFSLSADQMEEVVDKLNKTADRFPVTTEKLMTALQRMGSSASIAGLSLNESIGIATALSKATGRSGANVGTAANALIQYSTKAKALETYAQLSPEVAAIVEQYKIGAASVLDIWKALSKEINNLTNEQTEKLDLLANYFESEEGKQLQSELEAELGELKEDISGVFATANTFRKNYFVALLQNMDTVEEAAQTARDAQGYSIKENEKEMQTYEKRVAALQAQWQKLANDEQGWLAFRKGLVELGSYLLKILEWTGGLRTAFIALATVIGLAFGQKAITMISGVIASIRTLTTTTEGAAIAAGTLSTAWQGVLGIVGLIVTAISALIGVAQKYEQEQHDLRQAAIDTWKSEKDTAQQLVKLNEKYKTLKGAESEYKEVEEAVVKLLGDKATLLSGLTEDTKEYSKAVKELSEAEASQYLVDLQNAAISSKTELEKFDPKSKNYGSNWEVFLNTYFPEFVGGYGEENNLKRQLSLYGKLLRRVQAYEKDYLQKYNAGNILEAQKILESDEYKGAKSYVDEAESLVNNYINTYTELYARAYISKSFDPTLESVRKDVLQKLNLDGFSIDRKLYINQIEQIINGLLATSEGTKSGESINDTLEEQDEILGNIEGKYQNIVAYLEREHASEKAITTAAEKHNSVLQAQLKLEEAIAKAKADYVKTALNAYLNTRKTEAEIEERRQTIADAELQIEEKKKAVKEAQINLQKAQDDYERARNNLNVRVFNRETGMWESQANQKDVQSAQERLQQATENVAAATKDVEKAENDVQKAVENLDKYLQDQAVNELIDAIENNGVTSEDIDAIFAKWFGNGGGQWGEGVKNVILTAQKEADTAYLENDSVKKAYETLANAQKSENEYLREQAYNSLISRLTNGNKMTPAEWENLSKMYSSMGMSSDNIAWLYNLLKNGSFFDYSAANTQSSNRLDKNFENNILGREGGFESIINILTQIGLEVFNIGRDTSVLSGNPRKLAHFENDVLTYGSDIPLRDRGGILNGMGAIKATNRPELVIDPELTRKILTPSSNEAFSKFAQSLGIIFGNPLKNMGSPAYSNSWQNASTNDNRSYVINGVPISKEAAESCTIAELFDKMQLV